MKFTNFTEGDLIDVQGFGRCCVVDVAGSSVQVQGADGFKFWVHRRLVQSVKVGEKTGPAGPATAPGAGLVPTLVAKPLYSAVLSGYTVAGSIKKAIKNDADESQKPSRKAPHPARAV